MTSGEGNPTINVPLYLYGKFFVSLFNGYVDFASDPMYAMLATSVYEPNQDTHQFKSDVSGECNGSGYFEGGQNVTGIEATYNVSGTTKQLIVTGGDLVWADVTLSAAYLVLYMNSSEPETLQPLVGYLNFGGTQSPSDEAFYVTWATSGIFAIPIPDAA